MSTHLRRSTVTNPTFRVAHAFDPIIHGQGFT
jgi:hypothetical protein